MSIALATLQREMQRSVMSRRPESGAAFVSKTADGAQRLEIYSTAYRLRLQDALAHNFPMLEQLLGADRFSELAQGYLDAYPSTHPSVRSFGVHLASWLQDRLPLEPWMAEFARFEWSLAHAFDAPNQTAVDVATLAALDAEHWPQLQFEFAAAVQHVTLTTNAAELYARVSRNESAPTGHIDEQPNEWLIWREALTARYRPMDDVEATALNALRAGRTFAQVCEALFDRYEDESIPAQAAALLKRWLSDELISGFRISS